MKILFDINHPAHVLFFNHPAKLLQKKGHEVLFTSRDKDVTLALFSQLKIPHRVLSSIQTGGIFSLGKELIQRDKALLRVVKEEKPDAMASIGGTFIAHVGWLTRTPALVFYDTENAKLQNLITYPLASCVYVPACYQAWLPKKHQRYAGYHELSYLHPDYFTPNRQCAIDNGLSSTQDTFLIRLVSWQANHDIGEVGWTPDLLRSVINHLTTTGKVLISSETVLDKEFEPYYYTGSASEIHHVMAFCRAFIGESATMASECAVLGVPAIYAAQTGRGYTDEQEKKYGLVFNTKQLDWQHLKPLLDKMLGIPHIDYQRKRQRLLSDTIDVAQFVSQQLIKTAEHPGMKKKLGS